MVAKRYKVGWAKIGNSAGFRLSANFFRDFPQYAGAEGSVEVLGNGKLLVCLSSAEDEQREDEIMLSLYLDFVMKRALADPGRELEAYTEAMAAEDDELMAGIIIDTDP
ncbi:MAG: hypothetical protein KME03_04675 [Aphanocapsa lilacina HA4352-LM1]|jgi:antitoxin PrlF|nr:hypothetical protein [Aphanocapsa lilacina HA4352-LM1]